MDELDALDSDGELDVSVDAIAPEDSVRSDVPLTSFEPTLVPELVLTEAELLLLELLALESEDEERSAASRSARARLRVS